jgi:hypothetical protein
MHKRDGERRCRSSFQLPERRSGFDRRRPGDPLRRLLDQPAALLAVLVALNLLSAADWMLTSNALAHGAREANLLLASLISSSPLAAGVFKAAAVLAVSAVIWRARRYRAILAVAVGAVGLYVMLMLYHAAGLARIGVL